MFPPVLLLQNLVAPLTALSDGVFILDSWVLLLEKKLNGESKT